MEYFKVKRIFTSGFIAISLFVVVLIIFYSVKSKVCSYQLQSDNLDRYNWIFQDSIKSKLHKLQFVGNDKGGLFIYLYDNKTQFLIWESKDLRTINLNRLKISKTSNISIDKETATSGDSESSPEIITQVCLSFIDCNNILINESSKILKDTIFDNVRFIMADIKQLGFPNESNIIQMIFDYKMIDVRTGILFYKNKDSFYTVLINSRDNSEITFETLKLLKLK